MKSSTQSSSQGSFGPLNNIHYQLNNVYMDNFGKNPTPYFPVSMLDGVLPLQFNTNGSSQVSRLPDTKATKIGSFPFDASVLEGVCRNMEHRGTNSPESTTKCLNAHKNILGTPADNPRQGSVGYSIATGVVQRLDIEERSNQVLQNLTLLPPLPPGEPISNVHSGAPPPWLEMTENEANPLLESFKMGKSQKLRNPKRVGAAWAEKRREELEKEKRGEVIANSCDADWLPNFGRVWQAGTRKESRKEFEMEKQKMFKVENVSEASVELQPYISKRMRKANQLQAEASD